jgi:hypothetical protein
MLHFSPPRTQALSTTPRRVVERAWVRGWISASMLTISYELWIHKQWVSTLLLSNFIVSFLIGGWKPQQCFVFQSWAKGIISRNLDFSYNHMFVLNVINLSSRAYFINVRSVRYHYR